MKKALFFVCSLFALALTAPAQPIGSSGPPYRGARTTAQEPATCTANRGQYYYNTTEDEFRYCPNGSWVPFLASSSGSILDLKLIDKAYTPFLSGTSYLTLGTATPIVKSNHFWAIDMDLPLSVSGSSKFFAGQRTNINFAGTPASSTMWGHYVNLTTSGLSGANNQINGVYSTVDLSFPAQTAIGGYFRAIHGGSGASGTVEAIGVRGTATIAHNGALTNGYAGDFYLQVSASPGIPSTTDNAYILRTRLLNNADQTITNVRGLSLADWTNTTGVVTNSYGIYMDASIDVGTTTKYAIYSTSTSKSLITGTTALGPGAPVTAAATIVISGNFFHVTGNTNITSISGTGVDAGTCITIIFDGTPTLTDGSNLKMAGNFVATADDSWSGCWDGVSWFERARSVN